MRDNGIIELQAKFTLLNNSGSQKPGYQTNQQTNPTRGRQGIQSPKTGRQGPKTGDQAEKGNNAGWLGRNTRQSGRGLGKMDWYIN